MVLARPFVTVTRTLSNDDRKETTLIEHLEELRWRLGVCLCAVVADSIAGWFLVRPLFTLLVAPPVRYGVPLVLSRLTDPFVLEVKLALAVGLALALPVLLAPTWLFVAPAIAVQARRYVLPMVALGLVLFVLGAGVGYTLFPMVVRSLLQVGDYVTQFALVLMVFGAIFELPLVLAALAQLGVVSSHQLAAWPRRSTGPDHGHGHHSRRGSGHAPRHGRAGVSPL
jgi:sec-independent protein translocase protein TatC